ETRCAIPHPPCSVFLWHVFSNKLRKQARIGRILKEVENPPKPLDRPSPPPRRPPTGADNGSRYLRINEKAPPPRCAAGAPKATPGERGSRRILQLAECVECAAYSAKSFSPLNTASASATE